MSEFSKGQRVRITEAYATIEGQVREDLQTWVGLEGTVIFPAEHESRYNVLVLDDPPEDNLFGYRFFTYELEAIEEP